MRLCGRGRATILRLDGRLHAGVIAGGAVIKRLCAVLVLSLAVGAWIPAAAEVLELTTSVEMPAPATEAAMQDAIRAAAREVLNEVGSFKPVMIAVTAAYVSAGRLYVRFVIADEAGARSLGVRGGNSEDPDSETAARHDSRI
jgi:hypothetical protein